MAVPGAARPHSLDALLHMPLEQLLQLQVWPRRTAQASEPDAPVARALRADQGPQHAV